MEKARDKDMLDKALSHEKAIQDLEEKEKEARRLEGIELQ